MPRRTLHPYKILAVALGAGAAGAACGKEPRPDPPTAAQERAAAVAAAPAPSVAPPPVTPDDKADRALLALRQELDAEGPAAVDAPARAAHYRPLCDKDGYPLVGNLNRKGAHSTTPSGFCEALRAKKPPS